MNAFTLDNGLQCIFEGRKNTGVVAAQIWVKVGSKYEENRIAGITHLIEHLIFKGTETVKANEMASRIESLGGSINAFTSYDNTVYHVVVPSKAFEEGFQLLLGAVLSPVFPKEEITKEKKVILEEIEMGEDDPQRKLFNELFKMSYRGHPYGRPIIGFANTVSGMDREDIRSYHNIHYTPENIVIVIVGDFDEKRACAMIKKYMTVSANEPAQSFLSNAVDAGTERDGTGVIRKDVKESYLALSYAAPPMTDDDTPALEVLETILGNGESSRLQKELKRDKGLVTNSSVYLFTPKEEGLFIVLATFKGEDYGAVLAGIDREIKVLWEKGTTEWEIEKAKNMIRASYIYSEETAQGRARQIGNFQTLAGDPSFADEYLKKIDAIRNGDLRRVLEKYITGKEKAGLAVLLPKAGSNPHTHVLGNSLKLVMNVNHASPSFAFRIGFVGGLKEEPPEKNGIFNLLSCMLLKGTKHKDAVAIAKEIDMLAGELSPYCGKNIFGLAGKFLSKDAQDVFRLLSELLTTTVLKEDELKKVKEEVLSDLRQRDDDPANYTFLRFNELLFDGHPYAKDPSGTEATIPQILLADLEKFYGDYVSPANAVLAISGHFEEKELMSLVKELFLDWEGKPNLLRNMPASQPFKQVHSVKREIRQMHLIFGFLGPGLADRNRCPLEVMVAILSGMGGRIHKIFREDNPYAYALTFFNQMAFEAGGMGIYIGTDPKLKKKVEEMVTTEIRRIRDEGFTAQEVENGKRYLIGNHYVRIQANSAISTSMCLDTLYGLTPGYFKLWPKEIEKVTREQVNRAARDYLSLERMVELVVGSTK